MTLTSRKVSKSKISNTRVIYLDACVSRYEHRILFSHFFVGLTYDRSVFLASHFHV